ncbi:MAG: tRNA (adenosine(37)-N6)-threonylcarbamoyltransferase complex ATPase subunit type 1 TsaE [Minisyncoccia bacterium]
MELTLKNLEDTKKLAKKLLKTAPSVIALYGDLGAGKTTLVQFLARALGVKEKVLSPTFVIIKIYVLPAQAWLGYSFLTHIDAYRLKSAEELLGLGLRDILKDKENIVVVEWPEKIEKYLPKHTVKVYFETVGPKERKVLIK